METQTATAPGLGGKTTKEINRDFFIRFYPDSADRHHNQLVGVSTFVALLGEQLAADCVRKAYEKGEDKVQFKFRRGIMIEFAGK